jgi:hypothetical protein
VPLPLCRHNVMLIKRGLITWSLRSNIEQCNIMKTYSYYSGVQTQDVLQMVQYSKKNKWVVHIYIFIFRHFCSKRVRHLRHTKMLIDGSGRNTKMFGTRLYPWYAYIIRTAVITIVNVTLETISVYIAICKVDVQYIDKTNFITLSSL